MTAFKVLVIGRGMMGSAAAKYLAREIDGVGVIGPDEPADKRSHDGVFASHYDEGRITRTIDPNPVWARLANRSIARYRDIEAESGIGFFSEVGCLVVGAARASGDDYIANVLSAAGSLDVETKLLDDGGLKQRFPFFSVEAASEGVFEPVGAGHISPRRLVAAQSRLAEKVGARYIRETALRIVPQADGVEVVTAEGGRHTAEKLLVATGGFTIAENLLPQPVDLKVYARTITFMEVDEAEAARLAAMPSLITKPHDPRDAIYLLPPIRYPDGRFYLKIGGDPDDLRLTGAADLRDWFRGEGRESAKAHLQRVAKGLLSGVSIRSVSTGSCVTSFTPTGLPAIGFSASPRIALVTGGCGAAAKSSDEIGRLGAETILAGGIADPAYASVDFSPRFL